MKVLKYLLFGGFFIFFFESESFTDAARIGKQFSSLNISTRAPLVHRVRERLTSIILHNYEHLLQYHNNYHNHIYHNHWNALNYHYYTTPLSLTPIMTSTTQSTIIPSTSNQQATIIPITAPTSTSMTPSIAPQSSPTLTSTTISITSESTTSSSQRNSESVTIPSSSATVSTTPEFTTLSPQRNSESVTLPSFLISRPTIIEQITQTINTQTLSITTMQPTTSSTTKIIPSIETTTQAITTGSTAELTTMSPSSTASKTMSTETTSKSTITLPSTTISLTVPLTQNSTLSPISMPSTTISTISTAPLKDPCSDRKTLYANSIALIRLCYINESLTWMEARRKCQSINYRLFEINTYFKEISMFNYFKDFAVNNEFHWINGIAEDSPMAANWYVEDPYRIWNYTTNAWYGLVKAPVPGLCLGIIFVSGTSKLTSRNCNNFHSTFWCEY